MSTTDTTRTNDEHEPVVESHSPEEGHENDSIPSIHAPSVTEPGSEATRLRVVIPENVAEASSTSTGVSPSNECCISIPNSVYASSGADRFRFVQAKGLFRGFRKPEDSNLRNARRTLGRSGLEDVTTLSDFLTYAQRNNYDIVIPVSRDYRSLNSNCVDTGCGYMVLEQQQFPRDYSATSSYHPTEFIGLNSVPTRNSVLTQHMYSTAEDIQPPAVDFTAPPPYEVAYKLPTYEEVQREKALQGESVPPNSDSQNQDVPASRTLSFLAIDTDLGTGSDPQAKLLGTDFMFVIAFFLALIFSGVGFLLLVCFCHTVAARYGALSGFGLSLAKWTLIVKNSTDVAAHNAWLWWLIAAFGFLICIRSMCQYYHIKRGWRLMSSATQERLLFFY